MDLIHQPALQGIVNGACYPRPVCALWDGTLLGKGTTCTGVTLGFWLIISCEATLISLFSDILIGLSRKAHLKFWQGIILCALWLSNFSVSCSKNASCAYHKEIFNLYSCLVL